MNGGEIRDAYDVVIIGAGPAGLGAATICAGAGLSTVVFDEQAAPGGQIYRQLTWSPAKREAFLGPEYWQGAKLTQALLTSAAQYVPMATVWSLSHEREVGVSVAGGSKIVKAERVIVATGALERPFPIPGWTLPGVMTAGAAQILLKSAGLVPEGRVVLAGGGPLLWLLAEQYLDTGTALDVILDTTPPANRARAWPGLASFVASPYFGRGVALLRSVRRKVQIVSDVQALRAEGDGSLRRVVYRTGVDNERSIPADALLLHQGIVPNVNLAMSAGVEHRWDDEQLCWRPVLDAEFGSSVDGIAIAGDGAGIAGGQAAEWRGRVAAIAAVRTLRPGTPLPDEALVRRALSKYQRGRAFIDRLYRPAAAFRQPQGDTIVCRCEEITAAQILETVAMGCPGPNQMKSFLRCGMGPCQGRLCGLTVTELIAAARNMKPQDVGYYRLRPPVKPITVAELAALPTNAAALQAVLRTDGP